MEIAFLGAAHQVTGSRFLVASGLSRGLVDCGLFQGLPEVTQQNWAPYGFDPQTLDWVVLSHAHLDHSGALPRLVRLGYPGPIYATPATLDLARILLLDSASIMEEEARESGRRRRGVIGPLYSAADAKRCIERFEPVDYDQRRPIGNSVDLLLRDAGHILGSSIVELSFRRERPNHLVFTGDLGHPDLGLLRKPATVRQADVLVLESTYGDRSHAAERAEDVLAQAVDAIKDGGRLLIAAFAVGRSQDVLFVLRRLIASGRISPLPVYLDSPLAREATALFAEYPEYHGPAARAWSGEPHDHGPSGTVHFVTKITETRRLLEQPGPFVVVSSSGMASGGRVLTYLRSWLPDPTTLVLFPGYQAEGTLGRQLVEGAKAVSINDDPVRVLARIRYSDAFSAHADAPGIMRWLRGFERPPGRVFLVHGEPLASQALAKRIENDLGWNVSIPRPGERVQLSTG